MINQTREAHSDLELPSIDSSTQAQEPVSSAATAVNYSDPNASKTFLIPTLILSIRKLTAHQAVVDSGLHTAVVDPVLVSSSYEQEKETVVEVGSHDVKNPRFKRIIHRGAKRLRIATVTLIAIVIVAIGVGVGVGMHQRAKDSE